MESKSVVLISHAQYCPDWFYNLDQFLRNEGFDVEIVRVDISSPKIGAIEMFIHKVLHRFFGHFSIHPFRKVEYTEGSSVSIQNMRSLLNQLNADHIVDLVGVVKSEMFVDSQSCVWKFPDLAWHTRGVDFTYRAWRKQLAGSVIEIKTLADNKISVVDRILSPSGRLSLFDYRNVYAALPARITQLLKDNVVKPYLPEIDLINAGKGSVLKTLLKDLTQKLRSRFVFQPKWVLGFSSEKTDGWKTISAGDGLELADPFIIDYAGKTQIFAEEISTDGLGSIVTFELSEPQNRKRIFDHTYHMSYPYLVRKDEFVFMIPESSANKTLTLYRCSKFPFKWERITDLFVDKELVDASIIEWEGKWWMFANSKDASVSFNDELSIFFSDALEGPWQAHKCNPICIDARFSRPAGEFITKDGRLYRYVQDCSWTYGEKMHKMKIDLLTPTVFKETYQETIETDWYERINANHTLNKSEFTTTCITDGYKTRK